MSAAPALQLRRSIRAAARKELGRFRASGSRAAQLPAAAPAAVPLAVAAPAPLAAEERPKRKRQRKVVPEPAAAAAAAEAAAAIAAAPTGRSCAGRKAAAAAAAEPSGPSREMERELWQQGFARVAGVDEAGRGPLAGPVVAAACVVPAHVDIPGVDDSKKLSEAQREQVYEALTTHPDILWAAQVIEAEQVDRINILQATLRAMEGAAGGLAHTPDFVLVDGNRLPQAFDPQCSRTVVKGDSKCYAIAAASIIAKVTRDRLMLQYHKQYPAYDFATHKGYGVPRHVEAIRRHGPCPIHRRTFAPVKNWKIPPPALPN